jgi:hypothetical protein
MQFALGLETIEAATVNQGSKDPPPFSRRANINAQLTYLLTRPPACQRGRVFSLGHAAALSGAFCPSLEPKREARCNARRIGP